MSGICIDCGAITKGYGRRCHSCAAKARGADPVWKAKQSDSQKKAWDDPELRQKQSDDIIAAYARGCYDSPETKQKRSDALRDMHARGVFASPEHKKKKSDWMKAAHARGCHDNAYTDEVRQKISKSSKEYWDGNSEARQRHSDDIKVAWANGSYDNRAHAGNPSRLELSILEALKNYGFECNGQYSQADCRYMYDILLVNYNTLIEVDGDYWHDDEARPGVAARDYAKDEWAVNHGFEIIRIPEAFINAEGLDAVVECVVHMLDYEEEERE